MGICMQHCLLTAAQCFMWCCVVNIGDRWRARPAVQDTGVGGQRSWYSSVTELWDVCTNVRRPPRYHSEQNVSSYLLIIYVICWVSMRKHVCTHSVNSLVLLAHPWMGERERERERAWLNRNRNVLIYVINLLGIIYIYIFCQFMTVQFTVWDECEMMKQNENIRLGNLCLSRTF